MWQEKLRQQYPILKFKCSIVWYWITAMPPLSPSAPPFWVKSPFEAGARQLWCTWSFHCRAALYHKPVSDFAYLLFQSWVCKHTHGWCSIFWCGLFSEADYPWTGRGHLKSDIQAHFIWFIVDYCTSQIREPRTMFDKLNWTMLNIEAYFERIQNNFQNW